MQSARAHRENIIAGKHAAALTHILAVRIHHRRLAQGQQKLTRQLRICIRDRMNASAVRGDMHLRACDWRIENAPIGSAPLLVGNMGTTRALHELPPIAAKA